MLGCLLCGEASGRGHGCRGVMDFDSRAMGWWMYGAVVRRTKALLPVNNRTSPLGRPAGISTAVRRVTTFALRQQRRSAGEAGPCNASSSRPAGRSCNTRVLAGHSPQAWAQSHVDECDVLANMQCADRRDGGQRPGHVVVAVSRPAAVRPRLARAGLAKRANPRAGLLAGRCASQEQGQEPSTSTRLSSVVAALAVPWLHDTPSLPPSAPIHCPTPPSRRPACSTAPPVRAAAHVPWPGRALTHRRRSQLPPRHRRAAPSPGPRAVRREAGRKE